MENYIIVYNSQSTAIGIIPVFQVQTLLHTVNVELLKLNIKKILKKEYDLDRVEIIDMPSYDDITENRMPLEIKGFTKAIKGEEEHDYEAYISICKEF